MSGPGRERTVSDKEILDVFLEASDPVLTTKEVANAIGLGGRGTYERLLQLESEGEIVRKKVGEKAAVWWYPPAIEQEYNEMR